MTEQKKYKCVLVDPAWPCDQGGGYGAINHYRLMPLERIKAMPVKDLAEDNAHCYLWLTNSTIRAGYEIMEAWGFTPRSLCCWLKPRLGLGNYFRLCTEHVLFGTRGKAPVKFNAQPNWLFAAKQEHSHKPEEQYAVIERMSDGPYLELFARRRQPGWDVWGDEIDSDIDIPGYPVPSSPAARAQSENMKGADHA
jgi:N6-adenosine-specific RNA methylase IME4